MDGAAAVEWLRFGDRSLLDRVCLPFLPCERNLDARNFDAPAHGFRESARFQSAAARHDLVIFGWWENFCIPVGGDDGWVLLRLFRSQRSAPHRIPADRNRINNPVVAGSFYWPLIGIP